MLYLSHTAKPTSDRLQTDRLLATDVLFFRTIVGLVGMTKAMVTTQCGDRRICSLLGRHWNLGIAIARGGDVSGEVYYKDTTNIS